MAKRWLCLNCGDGINAPQRMGQFDPRRYCLSCSAKPGVKHLIVRVCPTLERKRKRKVASRKAKISKTKAKIELLPWRDRNDLIRHEYNRLGRLSVWRHCMYHWKPMLQIRRSRERQRHFVSGHAGSDGEVCITLGAKSDKADICETLVHELAHFATWDSRYSMRQADRNWHDNHGDKFRSVLVEAIQVAYDIEPLQEIPESMHELDNAFKDAIRTAMQKRGEL